MSKSARISQCLGYTRYQGAGTELRKLDLARLPLVASVDQFNIVGVDLNYYASHDHL
jgi:hypothetical protein